MLEVWQERKFVFLASKTIAREYLRVLAYPKFHLSSNEAQRIWEEEIIPYIVVVQVPRIEPIIKQDPSDDQFLACAKYGLADYLVTGDHHLLKLNSHGTTTIIPLQKFLGLLNS